MTAKRFQRLVVRLVPRSWATEMEAESRAWTVRCGRCGFERSLWELGGIRWKANRAQRTGTWGRCAACGGRGRHTVYRRDPTDPAGGT